MSPTQLMFGRPCRTFLPTARSALASTPSASVRKAMSKAKERQVTYYNRDTRNLRPLGGNSRVFDAAGQNCRMHCFIQHGQCTLLQPIFNILSETSSLLLSGRMKSVCVGGGGQITLLPLTLQKWGGHAPPPVPTSMPYGHNIGKCLLPEHANTHEDFYNSPFLHTAFIC